MRIALMGLSRTGKDTIAQIVREQAVDYYYRLAFGDGLREELFRLVPALKDAPKPRKAFETFGQSMRSINPDIWVKHLERRMGIVENYVGKGVGHSYIITDLRQPNEHDWAVRNGFKIVRVVSPEKLRRERAAQDAEFVPVGESEKFIDTLFSDHVLINNGSIHDLTNEVKHMMDSLRVERRNV